MKRTSKVCTSAYIQIKSALWAYRIYSFVNLSAYSLLSPLSRFGSNMSEILCSERYRNYSSQVDCTYRRFVAPVLKDLTPVFVFSFLPNEFFFVRSSLLANRLTLIVMWEGNSLGVGGVSINRRATDKVSSVASALEALLGKKYSLRLVMLV